jgi:heptaprenyl diphosphate synthase
MPSSDKLTTRDMTQLGILLAAAIALRLAESTVAYLLPLPGAHLGLANTVTIIVLYLYGTHRAALFLTARVILTGLLFTGLFSPGFNIGLGGATLSFLTMAVAVTHNWFSSIGVGVCGAFFHNCGQILVAMVLMRTTSLLSYLPILIAIGIPTGIFTGLLAGVFLKRSPSYRKEGNFHE